MRPAGLTGQAGATGTEATLAHKYQHLLHFSERMRAVNPYVGDTWLDEGFAMLASDLVGRGYLAGEANAVGHVDRWLRYHQKWSLTDWQLNDPLNGSYGGAYLFARYLYDQYGAARLLAMNQSTASSGMSAVTGAVGGTFADLFSSWTVALLNEYRATPLQDARFNYGPAFHLVSSGTAGSGVLVGRTAQYPTDATPRSSEGGFGPLRPWGLEFLVVLGGTGADSTAQATENLSSGSGGAGNLGLAVVKIR